MQRGDYNEKPRPSFRLIGAILMTTKCRERELRFKPLQPRQRLQPGPQLRPRLPVLPREGR
jgi:hypothetical protein